MTLVEDRRVRRASSAKGATATLAAGVWHEIVAGSDRRRTRAERVAAPGRPGRHIGAWPQRLSPSVGDRCSRRPCRGRSHGSATRTAAGRFAAIDCECWRRDSRPRGVQRASDPSSAQPPLPGSSMCGSLSRCLRMAARNAPISKVATLSTSTRYPASLSALGISASPAARVPARDRLMSPGYGSRAIGRTPPFTCER